MAIASFQVLAIIGAGSALAAGTCAYDLATQRLNVSINSGTGSVLTVSDGTVAGTAAGDIVFDGAPCGGSPNVGNTLSINVTTAVSATAELLVIDNTFGTPDRQFPSTIAWFVDLGQGTGDILEFILSGDVDNSLVMTNTSFTLNGGTGTTAGLEILFPIGAAAPAAGFGDDTLDGSALTSAVQLLAFGGGGIDFIAPGAHLADTANGGGDAGDTLSYGTRTTATIINDPAGFAGFDANGNGVLAAPEEMDIIAGFDTFETGSGNDELNGTAGSDWFIPGDGDDRVAGGAGVFDVIDYSTSSAGMVIDPGLGTATGQGSDTFTGVEAFVGSAFDDTLLWPVGGVAGFAGGDGIDTVDASARTTGQTINLDLLDDVATTSTDSTENALGGSASDTITGNDLRNDLQGNDGDDVLLGAAGNDVLTGGVGNDSFSGGSGADKISYATNTTDGIEADMNLGFVTSSDSGDDGVIGGDVEIVQGSPFNDSITGGGGLVTANFIFTGGNGKDTLTGSGSNDTLKGGAGNDRLRGLEGGDTLKGGKGKDKGWGGPGVDFCTGVEVERGCE
jgi:Ca2+-binding RTX toxin-like protein